MTLELIKEFITEHGKGKVEFHYMDMTVEDKYSVWDLIYHLWSVYESVKTISKLTSDFYIQANKNRDTEDWGHNPMIVSRCQPVR